MPLVITALVRAESFSQLTPERAKAALSLAEIREVKLGDEIFETNEVKAEVEAAKRRSRFRLSTWCQLNLISSYSSSAEASPRPYLHRQRQTRRQLARPLQRGLHRDDVAIWP
jgi:hypothetical protein